MLLICLSPCHMCSCPSLPKLVQPDSDSDILFLTIFGAHIYQATVYQTLSLTLSIVAIFLLSTMIGVNGYVSTITVTVAMISAVVWTLPNCPHNRLRIESRLLADNTQGTPQKKFSFSCHVLYLKEISICTLKECLHYTAENRALKVVTLGIAQKRRSPCLISTGAGNTGQGIF